MSEDHNETDDAGGAAEPAGSSDLALEVRQIQHAVRGLRRVPMLLAIHIGGGRLKIREILALRHQSIVVLNKIAGSSLDVRINGVLVGRGEPVPVHNRMGIKVNEILGKEN